jgi:hypothetical protein
MVYADKNPWETKSNELDRYCWLALRERHNFPGSVLRFARDALAMFYRSDLQVLVMEDVVVRK